MRYNKQCRIIAHGVCHVSQIVCHMACITCHISYIICHVSCITCHISCVKCHLSRVMSCHMKSCHTIYAVSHTILMTRGTALYRSKEPAVHRLGGTNKTSRQLVHSFSGTVSSICSSGCPSRFASPKATEKRPDASLVPPSVSALII